MKTNSTLLLPPSWPIWHLEWCAGGIERASGRSCHASPRFSTPRRTIERPVGVFYDCIFRPDAYEILQGWIYGGKTLLMLISYGNLVSQNTIAGVVLELYQGEAILALGLRKSLGHQDQWAGQQDQPFFQGQGTKGTSCHVFPDASDKLRYTGQWHTNEWINDLFSTNT